VDKGSSIRGLGKQELKAQFIELGARGGSDGLYPVVREGPGPGVEVPATVVRGISGTRSQGGGEDVGLIKFVKFSAS
jgi:hypothetical protein